MAGSECVGKQACRHGRRGFTGSETGSWLHKVWQNMSESTLHAQQSATRMTGCRDIYGNVGRTSGENAPAGAPAGTLLCTWALDVHRRRQPSDWPGLSLAAQQLTRMSLNLSTFRLQPERRLAYPGNADVIRDRPRRRSDSEPARCICTGYVWRWMKRVPEP
jgi:hypothetical protein